VLFFFFTKQEYHFQSSIPAPDDFDGEKYMVLCSLAGEKFLSGSTTKNNPKSIRSVKDCNPVVIAGKNHSQPCVSDLLWALTQPTGNLFIRIIAYLLIKIIRMTVSEITLDVEAFAAVERERERGEHLVLAPTHRSLFDFMLISFVSFSLPELKVSEGYIDSLHPTSPHFTPLHPNPLTFLTSILQIKLPHICAANDFQKIPVLGYFAKKAQAFFIKRGKGVVDKALGEQVRGVKEVGGVIEVFVEGTRSRDRRFVKPKTGFLKCLINTGGSHCILPITISYERTPEQVSERATTTATTTTTQF